MANKGIKTCLGTAFVLLSITVQTWSQVSTGGIVGTVRDSSGAVVPGAEVVLVRTTTNEEFKTTTNSEGDYRFAPLQAGTYDIRVSQTGFKTEVRSAVKLDVARTIRQDITLAV